MMEPVYGYFLAGSFSLGYGLLRIGFPGIQNKSTFKKLTWSYLAGAIVIGTPIGIIYLFQLAEQYFFFITLILYAMFFTILYARRIATKETDPTIAKKEKLKTALPKAIAGKAHEPNKINFEHGLMIKSKDGIVKPEEIKKQVFKEKEDNILRALEKKTGEMEKKTQEKERNEALERLRNYAQQIKKKGKTELEKAEEMDDIEEDLLNEINAGEEEEK